MLNRLYMIVDKKVYQKNIAIIDKSSVDHKRRNKIMSFG